MPVLIERILIPDDPVDAVDSDVEDPLAGDWTYSVAGAFSIAVADFAAIM
ncbi:MAG TPA: hypothetical protein VJU58_14455 [Microbacterium sp.]|nr:hypothetical protein [Microbacterium sp.]